MSIAEAPLPRVHRNPSSGYTLRRHILPMFAVVPRITSSFQNL